jgi:hypothetical protein
MLKLHFTHKCVRKINKKIIWTLVHLLVLFYELSIHARTWITLRYTTAIIQDLRNMFPRQAATFTTLLLLNTRHTQTPYNANLKPTLSVWQQSHLHCTYSYKRHSHSTWYCNGTNTRAEPNLVRRATPLEYPSCSRSHSKYKQRKFALPALKPAFFSLFTSVIISLIAKHHLHYSELLPSSLQIKYTAFHLRTTAQCSSEVCQLCFLWHTVVKDLHATTAQLLHGNMSFVPHDNTRSKN